MKITREFKASRINSVLNHPEVRPWVADMSLGIIDISKQVANQNNVLLMGDYGGCFFSKMMDGFYEVHTQVLPEGRGAWAKDFLVAVRHYIFTRTDACEVLTRVPLEHKGAKAAAQSVGMKYEFSRQDGVVFGGKIMPVEIYSERIQDWAPTAPYLVDKGQWLHEQMATEAIRLNIPEPPHEDDENHNRYVGACLEMMYGGQYHKAVAFYNRWAAISRHAPISLVSTSPVVVKFDVGNLKFEGSKVEIIP
jgi:hypothetical protein